MMAPWEPMMERVLYWSGSIGMGHVTRDMAIADKLRVLNPQSTYRLAGR